LTGGLLFRLPFVLELQGWVGGISVIPLQPSCKISYTAIA